MTSRWTSVPKNSDVPFEHQKLNLICVGRLSPEKNYSEAIEIFSHILSVIPDSVLWIVGSGPEDQALKQFADKLGLQENSTCVSPGGNTSLATEMLAELLAQVI